VGFADARETKVLIEVTSSARAQEVQLHSRAYVAALARVRGLERVTGVALRVVAPRALPVR
jgi:hypothetical protein